MNVDKSDMTYTRLPMLYRFNEALQQTVIIEGKI